MNKIAKLDVVPAQKIVQESVVEVLERALDRAKAGEIQSIAVAGINEAGFAITNFSLTRSRFEMIGAIALLHDTIMRDLQEES